MLGICYTFSSFGAYTYKTIIPYFGFFGLIYSLFDHVSNYLFIPQTVVRTGEPTEVASIYDRVRAHFESQSGKEDNEDLISAVEQSILHAHLWHTDEDTLPRRYDPTSLIWKFKLEFGIHPTQVARYLLQGLFNICELEVSLRFSRSRFSKTSTSVNICCSR